VRSPSATCEICRKKGRRVGSVRKERALGVRPDDVAVVVALPALVL